MFSRLLRITKVLLSVYYAYMLEYRAELLLWTLAGVLPFILMGAWMQAAQGGQFGLTPLDFARYFLAAFIARQFSIVWVIWEFEKEVVEGRLSPRLLQPIDPVWHHFISHFAERFARLPFALLLVGFFFVLYPEAFWVPTLLNFVLFLLAVTMAFCLRFVIQYTFALFAFWIERAAAIEQFWFLLYLFLSGLIAPLEIFPPLMREILSWTPFPYMIYFPAALLVGLPVDLGRAFLVVFAWGGTFLVINRWLWRQGLKRYSGMGA
ncbi:multidrug ABC transporter permease [Leptolyngbya sp. 'hensonii']|uniref:ABC transporter permease n=1 Tax=Leptolyngbya sp. 'hensonii' TaxID=1922337 RepID=UPI00094F624C|nr:ABC-2 family transporter protein [Leptolyngbya sp. 'hensonii']OLP16564.1 multidrug ABC transporter permease [Leptolyngbya sp. 'hensonii']